MNTIRQYIIDTIKAFDPTLDVSDNSALTDLLVNPGSAMLDPVISQINFLIDNLGLSDPNSIDAAELNAIAANFLKTRQTGAKAVGVVELFYNNPINLDIPAGTTFTSSAGIEFETTQSYHIPQSTMVNNTWNFPRYSSGTIAVVAKVTGADTSIAPNEISTTDLLPAPALVTNPAGFSGGADEETNAELIQRIIDEVLTGALGSAQSIKATLKENYTTIEDVEVRGKDNIEMLRDLVTSGISLYDSYTTIDFYGKVSGLDDLPHPESKAYWSVFFDNPGTSGLIDDLPSSEEFLAEFATGQYTGVYKLNDVYSATIQSLVVFEDTFSGESFDPVWSFSDSRVGVGALVRPNEIELENKDGSVRARMGKRAVEGTYNDINVTVPIQVFYNMINYLKRALYWPAVDVLDAVDGEEVTTYEHLKRIADWEDNV